MEQQLQAGGVKKTPIEIMEMAESFKHEILGLIKTFKLSTGALMEVYSVTKHIPPEDKVAGINMVDNIIVKITIDI